MNTSHHRRISRRAAEQFFAAGAPDMIPDPVTKLLAAAAAPARDSELAREEMAVSAFQAGDLVSVTNPGRGEMISSPLAKLLTTKAAAIVMAVTATGGVAVAATVGMTSSGHTSGQVSVGAGHGNGVQAKGSVHASVPGAGHGQPGAAHPGTAQNGTTVHLCVSLTNQVHATITGQAANAASHILNNAGLEQALRSPLVAKLVKGPVFAQLVAEADGATGVADLCGISLHLPNIPNMHALTSLPDGVLAQIPVATLVNLPNSILAQMPTSILSKLPTSALTQLPTSVLAQLPVSVLTQLPTSVLAKLPVSTLTQLPTSVLAKLPVPVLSKLPVSSLAALPTSVLTQLPTSVLTQLPTSVLTQLPTSVLTQLPTSVLTQLPTSVLTQLPTSVLAKLPVSTLTQLPTSVLAKLPLATLEKLPASILDKLPASILAKLPKGLL
jgi:hypothetical protein